MRKLFFFAFTFVFLFLFTFQLSDSKTHFSRINSKENFLAFVKKAKEREIQTEKLKTYFEDRDMPLSKHSQKFIEVAEKYNLPYSFLPAIAVVESSGGKNDLNFNPFGFGNLSFKNYNEAIETVGYKLTNLHYYKHKTIAQKLDVYNTVNPTYNEQIFAVMRQIERQRI